MISRLMSLFTFFLATSANLVLAQDAPTTHNIDDMFEVWLPNEPVITVTKPVTSYVVSDANEITYIVQVTEFNDPHWKAKIKSISKDSERKEFYLGVMEGALNVEGYGSVIDKDFTHFGGFYVLDYGASFEHDDSTFILNRVLLIETTVYSFMVLGKQPLDKLQEIADKWYPQIVFKEKAIAAFESRNDNAGGINFRSAGRLFGIVVSAIVLLLIIFFASRAKKRKQNES